MIRLFAASCVALDLATATASLGVDYDRFGFLLWSALHGVLIGLPLAVRLMEPLLTSMSGVPTETDREFALLRVPQGSASDFARSSLPDEGEVDDSIRA